MSKIIFTHILCIVLGISLLVSEAFPAEIPVVTDLPSYTKIASHDVWVDDYGRVFIPERDRNRISVYKGTELLGRFNTINPIAVATDSQGRIFVSHGAGKVSVYDNTGKYVQSLGNFSAPTDITVDSSDRIYVVDRSDSVIKVFNSQLSTIRIITGSYHPSSVAIDEVGNEIVVLDKAQVYDPTTNRMVDGAGIKWFSMDGTLLRSYFKFGYNNAGMDWTVGKTTYDLSMGEMVSPKQIAVDSKSRIYVTDARIQQIMVYDNQNNWLSVIEGSKTMRVPIGIIMSVTNRLYVASLFTKEIRQFGIDDYDQLVYGEIPDGTGGFGSAGCTLGRLDLCKTETSCEDLEQYWYDDKCNIEPPEPVCDTDNLNLCLEETTCTDAGGNWYDSLCNIEVYVPKKTTFPWIIFIEIPKK